MLHSLKLFGNTLLCVAGFSVYFLTQTPPSYSGSRITCNETLKTTEVVVNFNCDIANRKRIVAYKKNPQALNLNVKASQASPIERLSNPKTIPLRTTTQEIPVDETVEEVELTVTDPAIN